MAHPTRYIANEPRETQETFPLAYEDLQVAVRLVLCGTPTALHTPLQQSKSLADVKHETDVDIATTARQARTAVYRHITNKPNTLSRVRCPPLRGDAANNSFRYQQKTGEGGGRRELFRAISPDPAVYKKTPYTHRSEHKYFTQTRTGPSLPITTLW